MLDPLYVTYNETIWCCLSMLKAAFQAMCKSLVASSLPLKHVTSARETCNELEISSESLPWMESQVFWCVAVFKLETFVAQMGVVNYI